MLVQQLRAGGHRTIEAVDGREGLRLLAAERPDLVITDVLMPAMDGYELVRQMRLDPATRAIPVIFYTADYGEREARALALANGVAYVLTKPARTAAVQAVVERALGGESAGTEPEPGPLGPAFDREHLRLLTDKVSEQSGDLRASNARLRALINIGLELASERDPDVLLTRVCVASRELFGATYVTLGILDLHDRTVEQVVSCGLEGPAWIARGDAVSGILATVVAERRTLRGDRTVNASAFQFPPAHPEVQTFLAAPIASPGNVYGWICFVGNEGRTFSSDDEDLVMALSGQVGRIYENDHFHAVAQRRALALEGEMAERLQAEVALRASERLNRNLVEHLPHRILVKDRESNVVFCNANYSRDLGLRTDEIVGQNATAFYPPHIADAYNLDDQQVMASGVTKDVEEPYQIDGRDRWVHTVKVPYRDESGTAIGVLALFEDITERRTLEAQYQQAQKMEAIGRLAGGIAHDFNNLLTIVLGNSELLLAAIDPGDSRRVDVMEIQKAGASAAALTRQLLAFSRHQVVEATLIDLNDVVEDMRMMFERLIGEDVRVELALGAGLGIVKADRGQLEQIVMNLVVNARDAMPRGGALTIATANVELDAHYASAHHGVTPGSYVGLTVSDTGTGMNAQVQARLFEPFFTTKPRGKGTGLGLATVHGIVAHCGGTIGVSSELGRGTSLRVYLPRVSADEAGASPAPLKSQSLRGSETVLVVDDVEGLRELTRRQLQRFGYTVLLADGADAARRLFAERPGIDLVLTDVVMPGTTGPELTSQLIAGHPSLKVLYMSGYAEEAVFTHGLLAAGLSFVHKPFTADALAEKVRAVLDAPEP